MMVDQIPFSVFRILLYLPLLLTDVGETFFFVCCQFSTTPKQASRERMCTHAPVITQLLLLTVLLQARVRLLPALSLVRLSV